MLDRYLEPDEPIQILDIDFIDTVDEDFFDRDIDISEFNYECLIYKEPERTISRS